MQGAINDLIELFARMPGVGRRSATRLTFHLLNASPEYATALGERISAFHSRVRTCGVCANVSDFDPCSICGDRGRDETLVCVVESVPDLWAIEQGGCFRGRYHVLHGLLAPLDGIGPEDLNVTLLVHRVQEQSVQEVIVATRPSVEGEATAVLIKQMLHGCNVKLSRIASGIPHGSELEYADSHTLEQALQGRRDM